MEYETDPASPVMLSSWAGPKGHSMLAELEQYWRDLRGARRLPVRTDVNPAQIDAVLPHSFILERVAPGIARLRIAGQSLNALLGMESRGMPLSVFMSAASRPLLAHYLERMFDTPALIELPLLSPRGLTRPRMAGRMLILPLLGNDGTISRALGAMMLDGTPGRAARQFDIPADGMIRCEALDEPRADAMRAQSIRAQSMQVLSGSAAGPVAKPRSRDHLRLVVSNSQPVGGI